MIWNYDMATEPEVAEEVMVVFQDTISGICSHALAWRQWKADEGAEDDTKTLTWQFTADGGWLAAPFEVYGWARFPNAIDRGEADLPPAEEDRGEF